MNQEPNPHSYNIEFSGYIISFPYFWKDLVRLIKIKIGRNQYIVPLEPELSMSIEISKDKTSFGSKGNTSPSGWELAHENVSVMNREPITLTATTFEFSGYDN